MPDPLVGGVRRRWPWRAERAELQLPLGGLDRVRVGRRHDGAEAEAERQQVVERDRPRRRHGVVEWCVEAAEHAAIGELRENLVDRCVELQHTVVDEDHRRRGSDRFGQRRDPEDRVSLQRCVVVDGLGADHVDVHVIPVSVVAGDEGDEPRHLARLDVPGQAVVQPLQPSTVKPDSVTGHSPR